MSTTYTIDDGPKMLRETLCVAQAAISNHPTAGGWHPERHVARLGRLIAECDRHRPLGPDGKHNDRHTPTCGCEDNPMAQNSTTLIVGTREAVQRHVDKIRDYASFTVCDSVHVADTALPSDEVRWLADPGLDPETVAAIEDRLRQRGAL